MGDGRRKRARRIAGLLVLSTGAYGCRLILGIGDATEQAPDAGALIDGPLGTIDGKDPADGPNIDGSSTEAGTGKPCATTWCWENPLPQGQPLNAVWASSPTDIWAIGGAAVIHYDGTKFDVKPVRNASLQQTFSTVSASGSSVFALGSQPQGFQIARFDHDASAWRPAYQNAMADLLPMQSDLWAVAPDEAWAVGMSRMPPQPGPLVVRLKPGSSDWKTEVAPDSGLMPLVAVRGTSANDVWALSPQVMAHWNGAAWSTNECTTELQVNVGECGGRPYLVGVGPGTASALQLVTAVGSIGGARFFRWSSGTWTTRATAVYTTPIREIAATSNGDVWMMTDSGGTGTSFVRLASGSTDFDLPAALSDRYNAIAAYGDDEVIAVGDNGVLARTTNGQKWAKWPGTGGVYTTLSDVAAFDGVAIGIGVSGSNIVAVRKGPTFFEENIIASIHPTGGDGYSCWSGAANEQWYLAHDVYRSNGGAFVRSYETPPEVHLRQIRGTSSTDIWAVGEDNRDGGARGFAVHFDGTKWGTAESPDGSTRLQAVWIDPSTKEPWVVGSNAGVFRRINGAWERVQPSISSTGSSELAAIAGTSVSDVWVAGNQIVEHWDGKGWSTHLPAVTGGASPGFWSSLTARAPDDVWILAFDRGAYHWDGADWKPVPGAPPGLSAVTFDSDGTPWVVGTGGAILRHGR